MDGIYESMYIEPPEDWLRKTEKPDWVHTHNHLHLTRKEIKELSAMSEQERAEILARLDTEYNRRRRRKGFKP